MKKFIFFIALPILLTSVGEFILKHQLNFLVGSMAGGIHIMNPGVLLALATITSGGILWVIAMSKYELSFLYPFMSINYLVIIVGSQLLLKEAVSPFRYLAMGLIVTGLIFISRSPNSESKEGDV